jgi:hypothetical protein
MRRQHDRQQTWACHWSIVEGPSRASQAVIWICEYPYRTMRTKPCEDCPGCRPAESKANDADDEMIAFRDQPCPSKRLH